MEIWPAVDWLDGQMVRLEQGLYDRATTYTDDPLALFRRRYGGVPQRIHLVDLQGAQQGVFSAWELLGSLVSAGIQVEVGGGFRDRAAVRQALEAGAQRVVLGTRLLEDTAWAQGLLERFQPEQLVASIDIRQGQAMVRGWTQDGPRADAAWRQLAAWGYTLCNVTDISRDGTLIGLNPVFWETVGKYPGRLGAGGGIAHYEDLTLLQAMGITRAVIGKAWISGQIDLAQCKGVF